MTGTFVLNLYVYAQTKERTQSRVTVTNENGTQVVYHTSRRDALHQMLFGVSVLSSDRCTKLCPQATYEAPLKLTLA